MPSDIAGYMPDTSHSKYGYPAQLAHQRDHGDRGKHR